MCQGTDREKIQVWYKMDKLFSIMKIISVPLHTQTSSPPLYP